MISTADRTKLLRVHPRFLLACAAFLVAVILPDCIQGHWAAQRGVLVLAGIAVALGWFLLVKQSERVSKWRMAIASAASVYLTLSLPAYALELSPLRWFMKHPAITIYAKPWVRWGWVLVLAGVIGSFFGYGRARVAFAVASVILLVLWAGTGTWVY